MNAPDQWQVTPQAAELYERYPARYFLGPWAPLLVDAACLWWASACWTWPAAPAS